jgi:hypothetical protein
VQDVEPGAKMRSQSQGRLEGLMGLRGEIRRSENFPKKSLSFSDQVTSSLSMKRQVLPSEVLHANFSEAKNSSKESIDLNA